VKIPVFVILLGGLLFVAPALRAQPSYEHILHYDSRIDVATNGALTVTETIEVQAEGNAIQHGIYRDFPQLYHGAFGLHFKTGFTVQSVTRDGRPEDYHLAGRANGVRVYIGSEGTLVPHGTHTYQLVYVTDRQLGFFSDHDELYWNVTGNGWSFPLDAVTATVTLPPQAAVSRVTAYTGAQGERGRDFTAANSTNQAVFKTTRRLPAENGLTVVVEWPKGFVVPPSAAARWADFYRYNAGLVFVFGGWVLTLAYFFTIRLCLGGNRRPGVIIPLYTPPADFSPAGVRYLTRMGFDNKTFAASILSLAVRGALKIREDKRGVFHKRIYTLVPAHHSQIQLSAGEDVVRRTLVGDGEPLTLQPSNSSTIQAARQKLKAYFAEQMKGSLFKTNLPFWIPGPVLMLAALLLAAWSTSDIPAAVPLFGSVVLSLLLVLVIKSRQIPMMVFMFGFAGVVAFMIMQDPSQPFSLWMIVLPPLLAATNLVFFDRVKSPTAAGRKILDEIEGFKMYLSVAERDHLNLKDAPERTPQLFEQFLPYAFALGVEKVWQQKFAGVLAAAGTTPGQTAYAPAWYMGDSWQDHLGAGQGAFAGALGASLAGAISSSATSPGSSSGGGGGSSGGGGGGGGGGGW
jgi:uncharacterized membrane protein YgcG